MGKCNSIDKQRIKRIVQFIQYIQSLKSSDQQTVLKKINNTQIDYISEICLNFLSSNINTGYTKISLLAKFRNYIHKLSSRSVSYKTKRIIITSLKGLYILKILLPLTLQVLNSIVSSL